MADATTASKGSRWTRRPFKGWWALLLAAIVLVGFAKWDARVRQTDRPGFCPAGAYYTATARDFPAAWAGLLASDSWREVRKEWPSPLADGELRVRKATGVRPTPMRCQLWLGTSLLVAESPEGSGVCVYPGILLRATEKVLHLLKDRQDSGPIRHYRTLFYAWREGFLIVSASREYVAASLATERPSLEVPESRDEVIVQWRQSPEGYVRLHGADGWPVAGMIQAPLTARTTPLTLPDAWPERPLFVATSSRFYELATLAALINRPLERIPEWHTLSSAFGTTIERWALPPLPSTWDVSVDHCSFSVLDIALDDTIPMPRLACALRAKQPPLPHHPLAPWLAAMNPTDHEWSGWHGSVAPIWGEQFSLCLAQNATDWLITTQEPDMAQLLPTLGAGQPIQADLVVQLDWTKVADTVGAAIQNLGKFGLIRNMDEQEAAGTFDTKLKAVRRLGDARIEGRSARGQIAFQGFLAKQSAVQQGKEQKP